MPPIVGMTVCLSSLTDFKFKVILLSERKMRVEFFRTGERREFFRKGRKDFKDSSNKKPPFSKRFLLIELSQSHLDPDVRERGLWIPPAII